MSSPGSNVPPDRTIDRGSSAENSAVPSFGQDGKTRKQPEPKPPSNVIELRTREDAPTVDADDTAFQQVIAGWDDAPRCEVDSLSTHQGAPCQRRAKWRVNLHGCKQMLLCESDVQAQRAALLKALYEGRRLECVHCLQSFDQLDDAYTTMRL